MWDIYSKNFWLRGIGYMHTDPPLVKSFSKAELAELPSLTNRGLIKICDNFLELNYGNIFHGSSEKVIKNLKSDAESAYPLVNESFYGVICEFLDHKLKYGTPKEKHIYNGMSALDFIDRLLTKRCVSYFGRNENYLLISGEKGQGDFSTVGTDNETAPLLMENCLTRDEIKLSGFIMISSKVTKVIKEKSYSSVSIGIPFPILNREELFDYEDIIVSKRQNIPDKGYGPIAEDIPIDSEMYEKMKLKQIWGKLYGTKAIEFKTLNKKKTYANSRHKETYGQYVNLARTTYLDVNRLAIRLSVITIAIIAEGNQRAKLENKMAYIVIDKNKIGLANYPPIYEEIFLRNLSYELLCAFRSLNNTFGLHFVEFAEQPTIQNGWKMSITDGVWGNQHPNEGIEIKYSTREEFNIESLLQKEEYLVVETYRLDANALPGNELWMGKVNKDYSHPSYDVRHSAIPFIHNAHVNPTRICGRNLRGYSTFGGVTTWKEIFAVRHN